jgi:hypothetical protein
MKVSIPQAELHEVEFPTKMVQVDEESREEPLLLLPVRLRLFIILCNRQVKWKRDRLKDDPDSESSELSDSEDDDLN